MPSNTSELKTQYTSMYLMSLAALRRSHSRAMQSAVQDKIDVA